MYKATCLNCGIDTLKKIDGKRLNYFMLLDEVWNSLGIDGKLCYSCTEKALGRKLTKDDFSNSPLNKDIIERFSNV